MQNMNDTHGMQTIKTPTMKSKGCKNNFLPLKRIKQLLEKNILRKKKIVHRIPLFSLSFYAKLDTI